MYAYIKCFYLTRRIAKKTVATLAAFLLREFITLNNHKQNDLYPHVHIYTAYVCIRI